MVDKRIFALAPIALVAAACAGALPPQTRAAEVERVQCGDGTAAADDLRVLTNAKVIEAEPLYSHIITGSNGLESRVDGTKLVIRPPDGVSAERMTRILQCHSARALLGQIDRSQLPDDPFWLPDTWVSIEVKPDNGNYAVTLEANDIPTNLKLAARAKAYAQAHPLDGVLTVQ
jgi:hypothetical protein